MTAIVEDLQKIILKRTEPKIVVNRDENTDYRLFSEIKGGEDKNIKIKSKLGEFTTGTFKTVYIYENSNGELNNDNILSLTHEKWNNYEKKLVEEMNSFKIQKTLYMKPNGSLYIPNIVDYGSFCQCKKENCRKENPCINASITVNRDEEVKLGNGMGVYSIQEKIKGGELFDRLANGEYVANLNKSDGQDKKSRKYLKYVTNLNRQKMVVRNILNAVKFIHEQGYAHYDLKPENILMVRGTDNVKIIDFGFTKKHGLIEDRPFGTPEYISPEVKNRNFNQKADYWALGCLFVFIFCSNYLYQRGKNYNLFSQGIRKNPKQYLEDYTRSISVKLTDIQIDFLSQFFKNPKELWSFDQLLAHPYLSNGKKGGKIRKTRKKNNKKRKNMKHTKRNVDKKQKKTKTKNKVICKSRKNKKK